MGADHHVALPPTKSFGVGPAVGLVSNIQILTGTDVNTEKLFPEVV